MKGFGLPYHRARDDLSFSTILSINQATMIWAWTLLVTLGAALNLEELVGTWTTKSREVLTGPVGGKTKEEEDRG